MKQFPRQSVIIMLVTLSVLAVVSAAPPTTGSSEVEQIRQAAKGVFDSTPDFDPHAIDSIVIESDTERRFAVELIKSRKAEESMCRRAAIAVTGSDKSNAVRTVESASMEAFIAVQTSEVKIRGDTATMTIPLHDGGNHTQMFRKIKNEWKIDFLHRYRERNQINVARINQLKNHQKAAESTAKIFESKQERDPNVLGVVYESQCQFLDDRDKKPDDNSSIPSPQK